MVPDQPHKSCRQAGCEVATSGVCLKTFERPELCPNFIDAPLVPREMMRDGNANIALPEGEALTEIEADTLMRNERTDLVVVGGWTGSGKTTLITSMYESFLDAPFAGQLFAGSLTLPGFEKASHQGRIASGGEAAATLRTNPRLGIRFYHLNLVAQLGAEHSQLLIADMSGELLREACNSSEDAKKLGLIRRADHFVLLVDGENLVDVSERETAFHDSRLILRTLVEAGLVSVSTCVNVVFAKWDVIKLSDSTTRDFIEMIQREILSRFEDRVGSIKFFSVAARPETKESPFAFGVADLFTEWIKRGPANYSAPKVPSIDVRCNREFARFAYRVETEASGEHT
jgi:predicted ABC-type transport system involved in lysophospholipase L1 biosynthesis ATPase subunit